MNALALALRSLDPHTFEFLVTALLKARYPTIDIKHVDGQSGDQGLDVISGYLDEYPTIWQCKTFPNGIKDSQKQQVRDSLNSALKYHTPRRWVLCINIDLDAKALRWWQRLAKSHSARTELGLLQATDITQQLLYSDSIREQFFPAITLNVPAIREALAGTNLLSVEDLAALNEQNSGGYLARLEKMDARFSYAITHARNQILNGPPPPGSLLTVTTDHTIIHVAGRDQEALKANPPKVHFTVRGTGVEKFFEHHRTGKPVKFTSEELIGVTSDFDFLMPTERASMTLEVKPALSQPTFPLRVTFGKGNGAFTYEYILFRRTAAGTEEATFESATPLPFLIAIVLRDDGSGNVHFNERWNGHDVHEVGRMIKAIITAITDHEVDFYNLSIGKRLFRVSLNGELPDWLPNYDRFLDDVCAVANDYSVNLTFPEVITHQDNRAIAFLRSLQGGLSATIEPITLSLDKVAHAQQDGLAETGEAAFMLEIPELPEEIIVFGKRVLTGPLQYVIPKARVREIDEYREFLTTAPIGSTISLTLEPIGDITIKRRA